jgi:hypothetical protein
VGSLSWSLGFLIVSNLAAAQKLHVKIVYKFSAACNGAILNNKRIFPEVSNGLFLTCG